MDTFAILLDHVAAASNNIRRTVSDMESFSIDKIVGPGAEYGHDGLHGAFGDFCDRWQYGVEVLVEDANAISDSLEIVTVNYALRDQANADALGGIDPATDPSHGNSTK